MPFRRRRKPRRSPCVTRTDALLGITIEPAKAVAYLQGLELELISQDDASATFRIPTWRVDLKREVDLVEEVCRCTGWMPFPPRRLAGVWGKMNLMPNTMRWPKRGRY